MHIPKASTPIFTKPRRSSDAPAPSQLPVPSTRYVPFDRAISRCPFPELPRPQGRTSPSVQSGAGCTRPQSAGFRHRAPSVTGLPMPRSHCDPFVPIVSATPRRIPSALGITMTEETLFHKDGRWADDILGSTEPRPREFQNLTLRKVTEANGSVHHERIWKERRIDQDGNIHDEFKTLKAGIISDSDAGSLYRPDIAPGAGREANLATRWNGRGPYIHAVPVRPRAPSPSPAPDASMYCRTRSTTPSLSASMTPNSTCFLKRTQSISRPNSVVFPKSESCGMNMSQSFSPGYVPMNKSATFPPISGYLRGRQNSTSSSSRSSSPCPAVAAGPADSGRPLSRGYGR